jgi:hypothetical protein
MPKKIQVAEKTSKFKVDTESRNKFNMQMIQRKGHHRDKRPSMVSEMGGRMRGSYGNILQNNYNSRQTTFGSNRAISLDHYSNHRRMSDGIQTVTSDSTVYYHQRLHDQDMILRTIAGRKSSGSADVKLLVTEEPAARHSTLATAGQQQQAPQLSTTTATDERSDSNRVQSNNSNNSASNVTCKSQVKSSKLSSSNVTYSSSPKSIITRLRQLTGRFSFSFDKESRRMSSGTQQTIIKALPGAVTNNSPPMNNNLMPNICCNAKSAIGSVDVTSRNRAYSLDVPATRYNYNSSAGSSNNGSHKSLSSNKNDEADDSTDNNSVFASKKMSAEGEPLDI